MAGRSSDPYARVSSRMNTISNLELNRKPDFWAGMTEMARSFGMAMMGDEAQMEIAVQQSLDHWTTSNSSDIVFMVLKLIKVCHAKREDLVLKIFNAIFEKMGSFHSLFYNAVFGGSLLSREQMDEIEWYLTVGSKQTYVFQNEVVSMIDVPTSGCTLAAHAAFLGRTNVVLLFLRYGADPDKAAQFLSASLPLRRMSVLSVILRALPYPTFNVLKVEPTLVLVPRLKHLCKSVIRKGLAEENELPRAIPHLPIPQELKEYLDLLRDT